MRKWWPSKGLGLAAGLGLGAACSSTPPIPGNETLGTFGVNAVLTVSTLQGAVTVDGGSDFSFTATLSRFRPDAGQTQSWAFVTVNGVSRDAGFDGQVLTSFASAPRVLSTCTQTLSDGGHCYQVQETLTLTLLSSSQAQALGGKCPDAAVDAGIPAGPAIRPPSSTPGGFDAVRVCGHLVDVFQPGDTCSCPGGAADFVLSGGRVQ